jgi:hypothetical protein
MAQNALAGRLRSIATCLGFLSCLAFTSCQTSGLLSDSDSIDADEVSQKPAAPIALQLQPAAPGAEACPCGGAKSCDKPTVAALAHDLDALEQHIDKYGSVVGQHPDVWGQARLTRSREEYEKEMAKELPNFAFTLQGSLARSDQAYAADAFALSSAAAAAAQGGGIGGGKGSASASTAVVSNSGGSAPSATGSGPGIVASPAGVTVVGGTIPAKQTSAGKGSDGTSGSGATKSAGGTGGTQGSGTGGGGNTGGGGGGGDGTSSGGLPDQSDTFAAFSNITRTPVSTVTGPTYAFANNGGISVEPAVFLEQKSRYLNYLNHLRRINEGDDTADSPGYALNLVRIPVSVLPGKWTQIGHGADVTMTLTPHLSDELLPTTFRNLILNDLVEQIAYPVTQFINNPENSIYLDDRRSSGQSGELSTDVAELLRFVDQDELANLFPALDPDNAKRKEQLKKQDDTVVKLITFRSKLTLQPLFLRSEWNWVDTMLRDAREWYARAAELQNDLAGVMQRNPNKTKEELYANFQKKAVSSLSRYREAVKRVSFQPVAIVPATKSRRAMLPFPPEQIVEVYGYDFLYQIFLEAHHGLWKEQFVRPCPCDDKLYIHLPDVQGYLQEELAAANKLLALPCNCQVWQMFCTEDLVVAIRSHQSARLRELRENFAAILTANAEAGASSEATTPVRKATIALAWATVVEAALLNQQLVQDMKESAAAKGCPAPHEGWLPYFLPDPPPEARTAFNEYVRCRWPIHVFALDPVTQQQNISDVYSARREMQFAMSLAFVSGNISARNMMRYARRIELDMATIDLNNTQVGFSHGDETFGWRFYPRYQTPDIESNATVFFRDLLLGGPSRNALLRQRRLEPGIRECVAIVIMPSFVPYADLTLTSNWFKLTDPKCKLMNTQFAVALSKSVKTIETCGPGVLDSQCYRDGELDRLLQKAKQLEARLPLQSTAVQIPYENTLGGFGMFNTGVTDLAPELNGWYGSPSINPNVPTTIFLVGNHFSVHQTRVIAGGNQIDAVTGQEMLSRQVIKVVIPPFPIMVGDANQKFVDVHLATPYGVSQHLLIPVCISPCLAPCPYPTPACGGTPAPPPAPPANPPPAPLSGVPAVIVPVTPAPNGSTVPAPAGAPAPAQANGGSKKS